MKLVLFILIVALVGYGYGKIPEMENCAKGKYLYYASINIVLAKFEHSF